MANLTWLGHSAFRLDSDRGKRIYVDPFLNGNPKTPESEVTPERIDIIAVTHGHGDHVGDTVALTKAFPGTPVIAQVELKGWLVGQGAAMDELPGINKGGSREIDGIRFTLVNAFHSSSSNDGDYLGEACGIIVRLEDGKAVYFGSYREVFARDPKSKDHVRVIVLVTDGEDLEGDPVSVADNCQREGTRIDVVQIGGRAPEVIPDVGADGKVTGVRRDDEGKPLTTQLSAEGESQLARVAQVTGGTIVRAEHGDTGIDQIAKALKKMMREELSEKVETVYAEEYAWPLGLAVLLLVAEAILGEAPARKPRRAKEARAA